jgi:uncharacterized membrane protein YeiB
MTDKYISFTVANPTGLTSDRIVGYDFARSMALLGMAIVNCKMVMIDTGSLETLMRKIHIFKIKTQIDKDVVIV